MFTRGFLFCFLPTRPWQGFANEVNAHRHPIIALDQSGNQLKFLSQKQDVVLIKNLLVSVQSRWEKVVQRSVERGRALDDARKRAKQVSVLEGGALWELLIGRQLWAYKNSLDTCKAAALSQMP